MKSKNKTNEIKTSWVVIITAITMVVEIIFGITSGSMALLADGIHMGSHVLAIGLSWLAYVFIRKRNIAASNETKILSLAGYTSGLLLLVFAVAIIIQAIERFLSPVDINFKEAITVAIIGLIVNIISAIMLHHDHEHSDNNIKAAYIHVIADALTSFSAIIGLFAAWFWNLLYIDTIAAIVSSIVIIKWAIGLLINSGKDLTNIK